MFSSGYSRPCQPPHRNSGNNVMLLFDTSPRVCMCVCACLPPATVYCFSPSYSLSSMEILLLLLFDDAIVSHTQVIKTVYLRGGLFAAADTFFATNGDKKTGRRGGCPTNGSSTVVAREIALFSWSTSSLSSPAHFHHFYRFEFCSILAHGLFFTH